MLKFGSAAYLIKGKICCTVMNGFEKGYLCVSFSLVLLIVLCEDNKKLTMLAPSPYTLNHLYNHLYFSYILDAIFGKSFILVRNIVL
jgi:hypothetical protein